MHRGPNVFAKCQTENDIARIGTYVDHYKQVDQLSVCTIVLVFCRPSVL